LNTTGNCRGFALTRGQNVNGLTETAAQPGSFAVRPILCLDHLGTRGPSKNNHEHYGQRCSSSAFNAAHVTLVFRS
jgi:hypothetical protein